MPTTLCMAFEQPDDRAAREQLDRIIDGVRPRFGAVAELLTAAEPDLLAHFAARTRSSA